MNADEYGKMRDMEDHYWWFVARRKLALALLGRFRTGSGRILDVGCGTGALLSHLQESGEAHGLDYFPVALEFSAQRGLKNLIHGNAEAMPIESGAYAAVVSLDTLEHVPDDVSAAAEIFRVLEPGGVFVMNVPAFRWLWGPHDVALMHQRRYTRSEVVALLQRAGFKVEVAGYSVFLLFPVVVVRRFLEKFARGEAQVKLPAVSGGFNRFLVRLMDWEARLFVSVGLPWGSSVVAVGRKPGAQDR